MRKVLQVWLLFFCFVSSSAYAASSPTNFQLTSPPVPYPSFSEGSTDSRLTGTFIHLSEASASFYGGGLDYKFRFAPISDLGLGVQIPASYLKGSLGDDYASASMNLYSAAPILNLQWQALNSSWVSAIAFAGFNFNYEYGTIDSVSEGVSSNAHATIKTYGVPLGIQLGIPIYDNFVISPFFSYTRNFGGNFTVTDSVAGTTSVHIPGYTSQSFGVDFFIPQEALAIGTLIQNTLAAQSSEQNMKTLMIQLGWLFGVGSDSPVSRSHF